MQTRFVITFRLRFVTWGCEPELRSNAHVERPNQGREKVLVLVKALPHAGKRHGETVCCAGITANGEWRRQYPIHFRQIENQFKRWDWIEYTWIKPKDDDRRIESRRVQEQTIRVVGKMPERERAAFLNRLLLPSTKAAEAAGQSLAIIRPQISEFYWRSKTQSDLASERAAYRAAARQLSFFDHQLASLKPCPYAFKFKYTTEDNLKHVATCDDWETTAMFYRFQKEYGTDRALLEMDCIFNRDYPSRGMAFAMGTHSRFPKIWLLVGVIRLDKMSQLSLAL